MSRHSSTLLVFAGPNGSGKSTITKRYTPIGTYVNADEIKVHLQCDDLTAAQIAESTREYLLSENMDFTFETVLSTPRNLELMECAKQQGYKIVCIYILTCDPKINVSRVRQRVQKGGHDVPTDKIIARYKRAVSLIPRLIEVCDELFIYDNSAERDKGEPQKIVRYRNGKLDVFPNDIWSLEMLTSLINGTYTGEPM